MSIEEKLLAHPAADILPNMADDEFEKLKEDIAQHGLIKRLSGMMDRSSMGAIATALAWRSALSPGFASTMVMIPFGTLSALISTAGI